MIKECKRPMKVKTLTIRCCIYTYKTKQNAKWQYKSSQPSQKSIWRNSNWKQSITDLEKYRLDQVPRKSKHPLLTTYKTTNMYLLLFYLLRTVLASFWHKYVCSRTVYIFAFHTRSRNIPLRYLPGSGDLRFQA